MTFQELLLKAGYAVNSYSGRRMNGKTCAGVYVSAFGDACTLMITVLEECMPASTEWDGYYDNVKMVTEAFRSHKTDSLGKGTIVYFPEIPFEEEPEEENGEED